MMTTPEPPLVPHDSRTLVFLLSTSLAATFNFVMILVICFALMPAITRMGDEVSRLREEVKENRRIYETTNQDIDEMKRAVRSVNKTVEAWQALIDAAKKAKKKPGLGIP